MTDHIMIDPIPTYCYLGLFINAFQCVALGTYLKYTNHLDRKETKMLTRYLSIVGTHLVLHVAKGMEDPNAVVKLSILLIIWSLFIILSRIGKISSESSMINLPYVWLAYAMSYIYGILC